MIYVLVSVVSFSVFIFTNKPAGISANLLGKQDSSDREGHSRGSKFLSGCRRRATWQGYLMLGGKRQNTRKEECWNLPYSDTEIENCFASKKKPLSYVSYISIKPG